MKASDYRLIARESLRGKWKVAVLAGLVFGLLCGGGSAFVNVDLSTSSNAYNEGVEAGKSTVQTLFQSFGPEALSIVIGVTVVVILVALCFSIAFAIFTGIINTGYAKFNLDLVDDHPFPEVKTLFHYFPNWKKIAGANLLSGLYISLWSLLFFVPGIIAVYNYAMVRYIQAENPEMPARNVLAYSKALMYGNRWRLFCLKMSFFGWTLLCVLSFGIGFLWLAPYQSAAMAAFYRDISSTRKAPETPTPQPEFL
jgi:uncharacterized membrane protein